MQLSGNTVGGEIKLGMRDAISVVMLPMSMFKLNRAWPRFRE